MRKIYITLFILFLAMLSMAWFYFSRLTTDSRNNEVSLYTATYRSGLIFCIQNDKSIFEILKGQDLFQHILGKENFKQFISLKNVFLTEPDICKFFYKQNIYISILPGKDKKLNFLWSTQLNTPEQQSILLNTIRSKNIKIENLKKLFKLTLPDSSTFYLGLEQNLILLSDAPEPVSDALNYPKEKKQNEFATYIKSDYTLKKNSLANLFINFNQFPGLIKTMTTGLDGELNIFSHQNSFATLSYNFSKERLLFNGGTRVNDPQSYYNLFSNLKPQQTTIDNILPNNVANYTAYNLENYASWRKTLNNWFTAQTKEKFNAFIQDMQIKYRLNPEEALPKYTKNQFVTFQLSTSEKLGAINLINGDKLAQQLLDISEPYHQDIYKFKEPDLLYYYFGAPFKNFKEPYYTIIDNYMVFSNNASTVQDFLRNYKNNNLLINSPSYSSAVNQLSLTSNLTFYISNKQSEAIFRNNVLLPYYRHYRAESGLNSFDTFTYQLSGDHGNFQTNILLNKRASSTTQDTIPNNSTY